MTNFYDDPMDEAGNLHYGHFEEYFSDPERDAFFIYADGRLAGFAMLNPYSYFGGRTDHVMAEFTVFPAFRRRHIAQGAVQLIFGRFKGSWEIKYNEKNRAAAALWNGIAAPYGPEKQKLSEYETVLLFTVA